MNKILAIVLSMLLAFSVYQCNQNQNLRTEVNTKGNLIEVLSDSVRYTQDELNREVASKKTILSTVDELKEANAVLTSNQKKLLSEVRKTPKKEVLKSGVQIEESVTIDSVTLLNSKTITLTESKQGTVVKVVNSNPAFKTQDIDAIIPPQKKKFKDSRLIKVAIFVAGVATGVMLVK